ncbi:SRPBCC family protein [Streptomyces sp. NPDC002758]
MKIDNEFGVDVPVERAWEALTDLEGLAPCMPGAQLTGVDGDVYRGKVRVKVGPVISQFQGTARFVEKDEAAHSAVISAAGKDTRGQGNASATIRALLRPEGAGTVVTVSTDLNISGKLAQFGSGMIKEISEKLFAQFVANVEKQLLAPAEPETTVPDPVPATVPGVAVEPEAAVRPSRSAEAETASESASAQAARQPEPAEEGEPLDLMRLAGTSVYKRLIPVAVGAVVVGVVIYLLVR